MYTCVLYIYTYTYVYTYTYMSGGQNYLLPAMNMTKVAGPLSVVKVLRKFDIPSPLPTTLVFH